MTIRAHCGRGRRSWPRRGRPASGEKRRGWDSRPSFLLWPDSKATADPSAPAAARPAVRMTSNKKGSRHCDLERVCAGGELEAGLAFAGGGLDLMIVAERHAIELVLCGLAGEP